MQTCSLSARIQMLIHALAVALVLASLSSARLLHSLPEDPYAFPKYRVTYLNGLPLLNKTADRWLKEGLKGGELEFLDQPWKEETWQTPESPKEIGSGDSQATLATPPSGTPSAPSYSLEVMKIGPRDSYLCFIPKALDHPSPPPEEEADPDVSTARSWSLLQPLAGTCLYHRQGWFTYSYCHNEEIRQFKELITAQPHSSGGQKLEEDPDWESYTLGKAPTTPEPGADLTVAERNAIAANLELARGAGSRYLVQKWGDGTMCDVTGKSREVEVQFHCSMTTTDTILFVKETKTCSYALVIHTPRLCGEPGFRSPREMREEALIRCREIVESTKNAAPAQSNLPESDNPIKLSPRKPLGVPPKPPAQTITGAPGEKTKLSSDRVNKMIRDAVDALVANKVGGKGKAGDDPQVNIKRFGEDGQFMIEFVDEIPLDDELGANVDRITEALRAAGFDIRGAKVPSKDKGKAAGDKGDQKADKKKAAGAAARDPHRDEL
ncbi:hypothetical protein HGRIS_013153 [Hohenbuehelia grisea]|uniref:Protein OS-9 homolog n=1 Tax=Hohenbuehelia grisea TaxID=104357 RepID=A0ABR3IUS6_9AGAR